MKSTLSLASVLCAVAGTVCSAVAQDIEWDNAAGGIWHDATNWNPMTVPLTSGQVAVIGLPGAYTITIGSGAAPQINGFRFTNPNGTVAIGNGRDLFLNGPDVVINGTVIVNDVGSTSPSRLLIGEPDLLINGSGQIVLNDSSPTAVGRAQLVDLIGGLSTTLNPDLTLRGSGQVNLVLTNDGTISADVAGRELAIIGPDKNNNGLMEAVDGGLLRLAAIVDQGTTGRMVADGGEIRLISTIIGGEIDSSAGLFEIRAGTGTLTDVSMVTGDIEIENGRDLFIRGGLTMDGTVIVNRNGSTSPTRLLFGTSGTLDGNMTVFLNDSSPTAVGRAQLIDTVGGLTTTLAENVTVRGSGQVNATIINDGTISADVAGRELAIIGTPKTNNNLIQVDGGGKLRLQTPVNQGPDGLIEIVDGEVRLISTIVGGEIDTTGGLFEIAGGAGTLEDVARVTGDIEIENGRDLFVRGGLTMDGTIIVNRNGSTSPSRLLFGTSGTLDGNMTVFLNDSSPTAFGRAQLVDAVGSLTTTLAETVTVRGSGQVNATIINDGSIIADVDGRELAIIGTPKTNNNLIQVDGGGKLRVQTPVNQGPDGLIEIVDGEVRLISTIVGGEIDTTGGLFEIAGGAGTLDDVERVTGDVEIENGRDMFISGDITMDGTIIINRNGSTSATRLLMNETSSIDGDGEILLNGTEPTTVIGRAQFIHSVGGLTTTLEPTMALTGNGIVNGNFVFRGRVSPGKAGAAAGDIGVFQHTGTVEMTDSTVVEIQLGGRLDTNFDRIAGTAVITVDGTLDASLFDGFTPDVCENFVVISGSSVTGEFDTLVPPVAGSNQRWRLFYTGTSVELRNTCLPDIDGDCSLTIFDFLAFQNLFDMGSPEADFDGDGSLTLFDFLAFQNAFTVGCG
ncbi:MAG: GC-type dockerin domain-anchored protein [Phycisphaerales bacterium]|jgi:hypothetical protein